MAACDPLQLVRQFAAWPENCSSPGIRETRKTQPEQIGVGVPRGAESLIHRVRHWLGHAGMDQILPAKRNAMLEAIRALCPWFLAYAQVCYGHPVDLV